MKVLHVSPSYYPAFKFGGPIQSVHLLNKSLKQQGIEVDVFTTNAGLKDNKELPVNQWTILNNVRIKYFSFLGYEHYNLSFSLFFALLKEVKNYDIVHITAVWNFPVWAASFACWVSKKPYVISPRGTIYKETINLKSANLKKIYYKIFAEKCLIKASAIHYTSDDEMENVNSFLNLNTYSVVIPNGIDLSTFYEKLPDKFTVTTSPYILFLGRINKKKGLDLLFEAFKKINEDYPECILLIVGPDNDGYRKELDLLANTLNISDRIIYTGPLNGNDKISVYQHAAVFVLSSYSENFGMSVVEAMACGCPVVISDKVGIAKEIEEHNAGVITTTNPESIYLGIKSIIEDSNYKKTIVENALETVKELYDIHSVSKAFNNLYQQLIPRSNE